MSYYICFIAIGQNFQLCIFSFAFSTTIMHWNFNFCIALLASKRFKNAKFFLLGASTPRRQPIWCHGTLRAPLRSADTSEPRFARPSAPPNWKAGYGPGPVSNQKSFWHVLPLSSSMFPHVFNTFGASYSPDFYSAVLHCTCSTFRRPKAYIQGMSWALSGR